MEAGDMVERALATLGLTSQRLEEWLGEPCNCRERKEKLNQLSHWAKRIVSGKTKGALDFLTRITGINGIIGLDRKDENVERRRL